VTVRQYRTGGYSTQEHSVIDWKN